MTPLKTFSKKFFLTLISLFFFFQMVKIFCIALKRQKKGTEQTVFHTALLRPSGDISPDGQSALLTFYLLAMRLCAFPFTVLSVSKSPK
jgi:hypothetical protein